MRPRQNSQRAPHELRVQRSGDVEVQVRIPCPPNQMGKRTEAGEPRDTPCVCRDGRKRVCGEGTDRAVTARAPEELSAKQGYELSRQLRAAEERSLVPVEQSPEQ